MSRVAVEVAEQLRDLAWEQVPLDALPAATALLARVVRLAEAALVGAAGRLEATGAAGELGWASAKDFLTHVTGGQVGSGGGLVRLAGQLDELPALAAALDTGTVSVPQARVIARRVGTLPRSAELRAAATEVMLGLVVEQQVNATDLDRRFGEVVAAIDPDGTLLGDEKELEKKERGAHGARFFGFKSDEVGGVRIRGYASLEDAEHVKTVLMSLAAPRTTEPGACGGDPGLLGKRDADGHRLDPGCPEPGCAHDGKDPRDHGARMLDALVELCDRAGAADVLPTSHGVATRMHVIVDYDDLKDTAPDDPPTTDEPRAGEPRRRRQGTLLSGDPLSVAAVRRLACDAEIIPGVLGADGEILDVGRARRLVTVALWLTLLLRDRHCAFPGCTRPGVACDAHHVVHWADGGPTSLDNLVLLCRRHHQVVHRTPWTVHIDDVTGRPVWTPPPRVDDRDRFSYYPATGPPIRAA